MVASREGAVGEVEQEDHLQRCKQRKDSAWDDAASRSHGSPGCSSPLGRGAEVQHEAVEGSPTGVVAEQGLGVRGSDPHFPPSPAGVFSWPNPGQPQRRILQRSVLSGSGRREIVGS